MESVEDDGVFLHTFRTVPSPRTDRTNSVGAEPAEPDQENRAGPMGLAAIEFRIQQLHSRRFLLLKMQRCTKKDEQNGTGTAEERELPKQNPTEPDSTGRFWRSKQLKQEF